MAGLNDAYDAGTAPPCALCGSTGGPLGDNRHKPTRTRTPIGVVCHCCYNTVRYRARHGLDLRLGRRAKRKTTINA